MRHPRLTVAALAGTLVLVTAACGSDEDPTTTAGEGEGRTVEVEMVDIAFEPETLTVEQGETVTFRFTNNGRVAHDAFIGDAEAQADHEAEMADGGDGGHGHGGDDADAIVVEPGETGTLTHTFDDAGTVEIGCHQPGHYDAGMKIDIDVS
jgi:uncharacterized cupredoxin-like copper-binding protein